MKLFNWLESNPAEAEDGAAEPPPSPRLNLRLQELDRIQVKDVMIPRPLVNALDADVQLRRVRRLKSAKVAQFPVYQGDLDHILGWISKTKALELLAKPNEDVRLSDHVQPVGIIREDLPLSKLADAFLLAKSPFLVVQTAHGLTAGIVTLTELVEQIFGLELEPNVAAAGADISLLRGYEL